jgi:hydrogenase maturation protease
MGPFYKKSFADEALMNSLAEREVSGGTKSALLVIGYGNELRSDDGVGPKTATAVAAWNLTGIRALTCHQLTPELAVPIAATQCVVFVDACVDSTTSVELRPLQPAAPDQVMTHTADPRLLLRLAKEVFGRCPSAFLVTIPIENIAFGASLSAQAREGSETALKKIRELLGVSTR